MATIKRIELPPLYYLDHFNEMLAFVEKTYAVVLDDEHTMFIDNFRSLTADQQRLFVRLLNRRGRIFNRRHLGYEEVGNLPAAIAGLIDRGYLRNLQPGDYTAWLTILTKEMLLCVAREASAGSIRSSWSKGRVIERIIDAVPFVLASEIAEAYAFVSLANDEPLRFLLYLYFGKTNRDLKSFALRDLGLVRVNDAKTFQARFEDAAEAKASFYYSHLLDGLAKGTIKLDAAAEKLRSGPLEGGDYAEGFRCRAALAIGRLFERNKDSESAIRIYRLAASPECQERLVRLLFNAGAKEEARTIVERMIDDPGSDDEHNFASDFLARAFGGQRTGASTQLLRSGREIVVDEIHRGNPEAGVASVLRRDGARVYHAENDLWRTLFGLLFWEELFESGQLHSGFDWVPQCLKDRRFAQLFAPQIEQKLSAIRQGEALPRILKALARYWGRPNGVFSWSNCDPSAIRDLLSLGNREATASIIHLMAVDYATMCDGFPDLMLVKGASVSFVEVKAAGDAIRRNQLTRLLQLRKSGFDVDIYRADYRFDPNQVYAVVDIETTGGMGGGDRITEIGALKVRNHEVIGQWHTLINPQRAIPESIIRLTRITNEMVRHAPLFAEVADSFMEFMGDSIFVAHNVNFDYRFIGKEYARLDRRFRFPKFCTCAGMRRYYPGHRSYSLGNLCGIYQISLEQHHRALCDAEAAAKLLNIINRKRQSLA